MRGDGDGRMAGWAALAPMVLVAVVVLVIALVVRGSQTSTIVIQKLLLTATTLQNDHQNHPTSIAFTEITETSANGTAERDFTSNTFSRLGFQQVVIGQAIQLYDPLDRTIFATTAAAERRALDAEIALTEPKGTASGSSSNVQSARLSFVAPGRRSVFEQQLLAHRYRVAGRATIDGRPALKLVPVAMNQLLSAGTNGAGTYASLPTAYVSPRTYDPIEEVNRSSLGGMVSTATVRWQIYRVLPATTTNQRLLSLTARHPRARIIESARAFLRATQSEQRPTGTLGMKRRPAPRLSSTASG